MTVIIFGVDISLCILYGCVVGFGSILIADLVYDSGDSDVIKCAPHKSVNQFGLELRLDTLLVHSRYNKCRRINSKLSLFF